MKELSEKYLEKKGKLQAIAWGAKVKDGKNFRQLVTYKCDCGNIVDKRPNDVINNGLKSCGKCGYHGYVKPDKPKHCGEKFGKLTILGWGGYNLDKNGWKRNLVQCKCDCGNIIDKDPSSINSCLVTSCGSNCKLKELDCIHLNKEFGILTVVGFGKKVKGNLYYKCRCRCGKICEKCPSGLYNGRIYSCGCSTAFEDKIKSMVGQTVNNLTILSISDFKDDRNSAYYNCVCKCGKECLIKACLLTKTGRADRKHCGNCNLMKNGRATSYTNIKLHEMFGGEHNYKTDVRYGKNNHRINVDLAFPDEKIIIEFDCAYWHSSPDSQLKDMEQSLALTQAGWKLLRILSKRDLPTKEQIEEKLQELRDGATFRTLEV